MTSAAAATAAATHPHPTSSGSEIDQWINEADKGDVCLNQPGGKTRRCIFSLEGGGRIWERLSFCPTFGWWKSPHPAQNRKIHLCSDGSEVYRQLLTSCALLLGVSSSSMQLTFTSQSSSERRRSLLYAGQPVCVTMAGHGNILVSCL